MSNLNDYTFSKMLGTFEQKVIAPQRKKVDDASKIMNDPDYKWRDDVQKEAGREQLKNYNAWLQFYQTFYEEGLRLCVQHETLVNTMSKVYSNWYDNISNEGRMETEIMSMQADMLCEMMGEIYRELLPLELEGLKPPNGLNL